MKRATLFCILILLSLAGLAQTASVWPGDANNNGVANHVDLLYLGLNYNLTGPARVPPSGVWAAQPANLWGGPVLPLPDAAYSDCNGDGIVSFPDKQILVNNFGMTHGTLIPDSTSISNQFLVPELAINVPLDTFVGGRTYVLDLQYGVPGNVVDSLYGLAFSLAYDTALVDTIYLDFSGSWLTGGGTSLLEVQMHQDTLLQVGVTRINHVNAVNGSGSIGGIVVVMVDNLKTAVTSSSLNLHFTKVLAMTTKGTIVRANPQSKTVTVISHASEPAWAAKVALYPNPSSGRVQLLGPAQLFRSGKLEILDAQGRVCKVADLASLNADVLDLTDWAAGLYFFRFSGPDFSFSRKWILSP